MPCILAFMQDGRVNTVGIFGSEHNAVGFLESIPFIRRDTDEYGVRYYIPRGSLPDSFIVRYNGWKYVLSRFSYSDCESSGDIEAVLTNLCDFDSAPAQSGAFADASTILDAYVYENGKILRAIEKREAFYREAVSFFEKQGRKTVRAGLGSQDGEYFTVPEPDGTEFYAYLEPQVIAEWEEAGSFEKWLKRKK